MNKKCGVGQGSIIIEKYRELPKKIQRNMRDMGIKFSQLKAVKKVCWGAYILMFREAAGFTLKTEVMVKNGVIWVEDIGCGIHVAIKPKMEEHDVVRATCEIIPSGFPTGDKATDNTVIPEGAEGTIVSPINDRGLCLVEFPDQDNAVMDCIAAEEIELIWIL